MSLTFASLGVSFLTHTQTMASPPRFLENVGAFIMKKCNALFAELTRFQLRSAIESAQNDQVTLMQNLDCPVRNLCGFRARARVWDLA